MVASTRVNKSLSKKEVPRLTQGFSVTHSRGITRNIWFKEYYKVRVYYRGSLEGLLIYVIPAG